ncbi:MAG: hypothetical protein ACMG6E_09395 [Candidatus Roizmanbacteria bacterium]
MKQSYASSNVQNKSDLDLNAFTQLTIDLKNPKITNSFIGNSMN